MINARELRIGNYVYDDSLGVRSIGVIDADWLLRYVEMPFDTMKPIPLSNEIMPSLGFKPDFESVWELPCGPFVLKWSVGSEMYVETHKHGVVESFREVFCGSVHDLQNLFHALSRQELEITL